MEIEKFITKIIESLEKSGTKELIIAGIIIFLIVLMIRDFVAWMLRINVVINNQEEQTGLLKKISETLLEMRNSKNREKDSQ